MDSQQINLNVNSLTELPAVTKQLIDYAGNQRILLFYGEMGAGKTTLIKSLCENLVVDEAVTSPTYSIVNEYKGLSSTIFHFDFYRLKNQGEAYDMGYEEYFYSGAYCLIEWPENIPDLLPDHYLRVTIKALGHTSREIIAEHI